MSKKEILRPFDIEKAKNGAKIRDSKGRNVRVICFDALNLVWGIPYPIVAQIEEEKGKERTQLFQASGTSEQPFDNDTLFIVEEIEEPDRWIDRMGGKVKGWSLSSYSGRAIIASSTGEQRVYWKSIFATEKQVAAAAATAQISQIMANDERFGGVVTDEEWNNEEIEKFILHRAHDRITISITVDLYNFIAFHTKEHAELFLEENRDLVEQFYML